MQAHRANSRRTGARADRGPIDADWLEARALAYASRWEATRRGVAELLERKIRERCDRTGEEAGSALELIPGIVERLVERRYVDDRRAGEQLCERLRRQGRSRALIRLRLLQKGVPESLADEITGEDEPESELRAAWQTARKRRLGPHCEDPERRRSERERHLAVLARQGFSFEIALQVVDAEHPAEPA